MSASVARHHRRRGKPRSQGSWNPPTLRPQSKSIINDSQPKVGRDIGLGSDLTNTISPCLRGGGESPPCRNLHCKLGTPSGPAKRAREAGPAGAKRPPRAKRVTCYKLHRTQAKMRTYHKLRSARTQAKSRQSTETGGVHPSHCKIAKDSRQFKRSGLAQDYPS